MSPRSPLRFWPRGKLTIGLAALLATAAVVIAVPATGEVPDATAKMPALAMHGSSYPERAPDHFVIGGQDIFPGSFEVGLPDLTSGPHGTAGLGPDDGMNGMNELVESIGEARRGRLVNGVQLEVGDGYHIRHPKRTWGTRAVVDHLRRVFARVRSEHPGLHRLSVGDLSIRDGGPVSGHTSHQSGRDVDLGLYYRKRPPNYPFRFARATRENLHFRATWTLIKALAATQASPTGVEWIMLDYRIQGMLYEWAASEGVEQETLDRVFQYPNGRRATVGLIRHFPGHDNHLHVRFKCPMSDRYCR